MLVMSCGQPAPLVFSLSSIFLGKKLSALSTSNSPGNVTSTTEHIPGRGMRRALGMASTATRAAATHQGQLLGAAEWPHWPPHEWPHCAQHCSHQHKHMAQAVNTTNNDLQIQRGQTGDHLHNALPRSWCGSVLPYCLNSGSCTEEMLKKKKWK